MVSLWNGVEPAGVEGVAPAKSLERELGAGKRALFSQSFFGINGTARGEAATGPQKGRNTSAVKTDREDQEMFHAQAPAFLKSLIRSSSAAEKEGLFCV